MTLPQLVAVARHGGQVELHPEARGAIIKSREAVDEMVAAGDIVYGITTGFGSLQDTAIDPADVHMLQRNLIISHACGVGRPLSDDVVLAMMLLRAKSLAGGFSGVRLCVIDTLILMINRGVIPEIPEKGSLGASGDLCPLSHMVLPMLGLGFARFNGERLDGAAAMKAAKIPIIDQLEAKEGLALNNGTQAMTAIGALAAHDAAKLLDLADMAAALSLEALNGRTDAFDSRIHALRKQSGQQISAANIRAHTAGSDFINNTKPDKTKPGGVLRVQDAYALRCAAQVHGASRDAADYVRKIIENELNAVTDNPLIFADSDISEAISGGNFHGQPVALAMDFLGIALAEIANISERRIERMVNSTLSNGLPAYLTAQMEKGGLHSGFMIVQYSAAALVSENKILAHPASVDSIPSSNNQEDHVSMGTIAARKAAEILENVQNVLAMELLTAAQAIDLRLIRPDWRKPGSDKQGWVGNAPTTLGVATQKLYDKIRASVPMMDIDRIIAPDIAAIAELIKSGNLC
ncbi:MAG: histidine ammonia-lyase [Defluviitaleaceae bacterium]|nr:histidine ammonia-lyase [Defluviitaleaceae bacterium]